MNFNELRVAGSWEGVPSVRSDSRGSFFEIGLLGERFPAPEFGVTQLHGLVSRAGVLRGFHFSDGEAGQSKYVTCVRGRVWDVVLDVRSGSPTFGRWDAVMLDDQRSRTVFVPPGVAHALVSLQDDSTLLFACSRPSGSVEETALDALDPALAVPWPTHDSAGLPLRIVRSPRDTGAAKLADLAQAGHLPHYATP
ncbi:dTDP-4-dehydrorhamnose 3,5-epimerase family protein [Georgenia sp. SUBG003]|uniref:dTDP-4-dehydrorhamnose 3,5-epimerase family protein n=1 Tax=Georgenia sp. SUBG003 TaxID=1497974 RepID=UPI003AB5B6F1